MEYFKMSERRLLSKSRRRENLWPRYMVISLLREYTDLTLKAIGVRLGGKDHSTIINSMSQVKNLCGEASGFNIQLLELKMFIGLK